jgi:hypothetical protein
MAACLSVIQAAQRDTSSQHTTEDEATAYLLVPPLVQPMLTLLLATTTRAPLPLAGATLSTEARLAPAEAALQFKLGVAGVKRCRKQMCVTRL